MRKAKVWALGLLPLAAAAALWALPGQGATEDAEYRLATVERGDLRATVSATGTLNAVTTVQVGTQVSGQVAAIYVDFNQPVKKGQLLARIDPTLPEQAVQEAETSLARSRAELEQAQREYDRNAALHQSKVVTEAELGTAKYQLQVAQANVRSAQISVERARRNLGYTAIYAPIDGIVVERNVDVGQTVAASLSAPQLFLIAQDLSEMQILAAVDESDIGQIHDGQSVEFTVQAYPDQKFTGTVKQVRLQSTTQENVVSYTAVVSVKNDNGRLLPGMTATAEFVTGSAEAALIVPNGALRFTPDNADALAASARPAGAQPGTQRKGPPADAGRLWVLKDGALALVRVRTGLTDGQRTVVLGPEVSEGMQVITGAGTSGEAASASANPFQQQRQQAGPQGGPPRPGGF